jgi:hypothetical protein
MLIHVRNRARERICHEGQTLDYESPALTAELQAHFQVRSCAAACTLYPPGRLDAKRTGRLLTSLGVNTTPVCRA